MNEVRSNESSSQTIYYTESVPLRADFIKTENIRRTSCLTTFMTGMNAFMSIKASGTFFIDHTFYEMKEGDLFIIPGNTIHRSFPDSDNPVTSSALFFVPIILQPVNLGEVYSSLRCFEHAKKSKDYKLVIAKQDRSKLEALIEAIHEEQSRQLVGYRQAVLFYLGQLLLLINRLYIPDSVRNKEDFIVGPVWMRQILQ